MARESRFAQIYRQELAKNKGIMGSFASTSGARAKEILDLRQYLLPQMGVTGAISQRIFGKPFRYGAGSGQTVRTAGPATSMSDKVVGDKLTRIDVNSKITAKNSVVLPGMARDMNLMRMNMQKMVRLSGGTPSNKADMFFKRAGERESMYESQLKKDSLLSKTDASASAPEKKEGGGFLSGILSFLKLPISEMFKSIVNTLIKGGLIATAVLGIGTAIKELITNKEFRDSVFNFVKETFTFINDTLKQIFGDDVWTKLAIGAGAVALAFEALNFALQPGNISKGILLGGAFAIGYKIGELINEGINSILFGDWNKNYREDDVKKYGEEVAPTMTDPRNVALRNRLISKRQAEENRKINDLDSEISRLEEKKATLESRPRTVKNVGDIGYIDSQLSDMKSQRSEIQERKTVRVTQDWRASERSSYSSSPSKVQNNSTNTTGTAREQVEQWLGQKISDDEYNALLKGVSGEASGDPKERAAVASVILNRAKQHGGSIKAALNAPYQFQAITGADGKSGTVDNPASPNARTIAPNVEKDIANNLSSTEKGLTQFRSMNPGAWKDVGGESRMKEHLAQLQAAGGSAIGQQMFAKGSYKGSPSIQPPSTASSTAVAATAGESKSIFDEMGTMLASVIGLIGETNKSVQGVAQAVASKPSEASQSIPSPYDGQLHDMLLKYHSELGTSIAS